MGSHTAFFYGTLVSKSQRPGTMLWHADDQSQVAPQVLNRVIWGTSQASKALRDRITITPAILHDYCRHKVYRADYPGIIPQVGKSVLGVYVTGLTDGNIRNLDWFEGPQYSRETVKVKLLEGVKIMELGGTESQEVEAETYVFKDPRELENAEWDFHEFMREKLHRWADTSAEYADVDMAAAADGHDPTGGRGIHGGMDWEFSEQ